ncbi:MAG: RsmF rRNA methyltransferase first C-terminal domain-containing protein [Lachnospiraceae bacterium]|nr:RsmF rRNA methyltransferase first C-terminal domain-containing protein [Lachnospiraceae bacterium]
MRAFLIENLRDDCELMLQVLNEKERITGFGDSLYLLPDPCPDMERLKVYRAGIKLGTIKKGRFTPDHALSHVLRPEDVKNTIDLDPQSPEALQYLAGMTINCDKSINGWCLVCAGGLPLGWGKASQGVVKNHYPKGLRSNSSV